MVHNKYIQRGGEDVVVEEEIKALESKGYNVVKFETTNDDLKNKSKILVALNTIWSFKYNREIKQAINEHKPDLVHVHNTFPKMSPSIYWGIKKMNKPIVQTLHNYRLGCSNGILFKDGEICKKCIEKSLIHSIINKCYRNSFLATLPVTLMLKFHRMIGTFNNKVDKYIVLTSFAAEVTSEIGIKKEKITVKSNFIERNITQKEVTDLHLRKEQLIFVGRISQEKGLENLLKALSESKETSQIKLLIVGDGPQKKNLMEKYEHLNLDWVGRKNKEEVLKLVGESKFLIMPSVWYETFGMVLIEAFSVGTPVIAPTHGGFRSIVDNEIDGFLFDIEKEDNLNKSILTSMNLKDYEWEKMSKNSFRKYKDKYTLDSHIRNITKIYNSVLDKGEER